MKKKKFLSLLFCMLMVVMQLSWSVTAIANSKTALKVSDIGDKDLYAVLATLCEYDGSNGGILYKEDAEALTNLYLNRYSIYESAQKVESFSGLVTYCPNLEIIYGMENASESAYPSLIEAIAKLENITEINADSAFMTQDLFDKLCDKKGIDKVYQLAVRIDNIDISNIKNFTNVSTMSIYDYTQASSVKGVEALDELSSLNTFDLHANNSAKDILENVPDTVTNASIDINNADSVVDVSRLKNVTNLEIDGNMNKIEGLYGLENITNLKVNNNSDYDYAEIDITKLPNTVINISLDKCNVITPTDGFGSLSSLEYLSIQNCKMDMSSEKFIFPDSIDTLSIENSDFDKIPSLANCNNLYSLRISNTNITEIPKLPDKYISTLYFGFNNISDISNLKGVSCSSLSLYTNNISDISALKGISCRSIDLDSNNISDISALEGISCDTLDLRRNKISNISALKNISCSNTLYLQNNMINDIDGLAEFITNSNVYYIDISSNEISDISSLDGISSVNLSYLSFACNKIKELPNLTKLDGLVGEYSGGSYDSIDKYRLSLTGNNIDSKYLTSEYVPEGCANDIYWVYNASLKKSTDGSYYSSNINETVISKILDTENYATIYTSEKSFSLSSEIVKYIKDNERYLYIYYINSNGIKDQYVIIDGSSLSDNTTTIDINFKDVSDSSEIKEAIDKAFEPYGTVDYYYVKPVFDNDNNIDGVTYNAYSASFSLALDKDKSYIRYNFDKDTKQFSCAGYVTPNNDYYYSDEAIVFYVDAEKDGFTGIDSYLQPGNTYYNTTVYNKTSDDMALIQNYYYNNYFIKDTLNISKNVLDYWKQSYYYKTLYHYDIDSHRTTSYVEVNIQSDRDTSLDITFPTVTVKDTDATLDGKLNGSTGYKIYDIQAVSEDTGYSQYVRFYVDNDKDVNLYSYYNGTFIYEGTTSLSNSYDYITEQVNKNKEFVLIPIDTDKLYDTLYGKAGNTTYNKDISSERILALLKYAKDFNNYSSVTINTISDKVILNKDVLDYIKENEMNVYFNKITSDGEKVSYSNVYYDNINNYEGESLEVVLPDVTISDSDTDIESKVNDSNVLKVYTINSVTSSSYYNTGFYYNADTYYNLYTYYDNQFVDKRYDWYNGSFGLSNKMAGSKIVMIKADEDNLNDVLYGQVGDVTYDKNISSEMLLARLKYNNYLSVSTIEDKVELSKDIVDYVKNNNTDMSINYYNSSDGKRIGYASVYSSSLKNANVSDAITIERPDITLSTSNKDFEKVFPLGTSAIYMTRNNNIVNGVSYTYTDTDSISDKLTESYYGVYALADNESGYGKVDTLYPYQLYYYGINLSSEKVLALIGNDRFATPTDKPSEKPTEATTEETTEVTKPTETTTETTTEVTKPTETKTEATTEVTKPTETKTEATTEVTKPTETTTEVTKPTETKTEATTEVTKPTETKTEATTEVTKPTETKTETTTEVTKPTETTTEMTKPTQAPTETTKPYEEPTQVTQPDNAQTDVIGVKSAEKVIAESDIVQADKVNEVLDNAMDTSVLSRVETNSKETAPKLSSSIFSKMKEKQKDLTVGVTDENNRLKYSWSFDADTITNPDMDIDLSMSFDTDRAEAIQEITGRTDVMYLAFAHHGALPGPAKMKTYVGDKYANGEVVYLYYFNEEKNKVETIGGGGLVVNAGYVEYTITHCSVYFLSKETANAINAVEPDSDNNDDTQNNVSNGNNNNVPSDNNSTNNIANNNTTQAAVQPTSNNKTDNISGTNSNIKSNDNIQSGDKTNPVPYAVGAVAGIIALSALMFAGKKEKE